jgi:hypothetical protein
MRTLQFLMLVMAMATGLLACGGENKNDSAGEVSVAGETGRPAKTDTAGSEVRAYSAEDEKAVIQARFKRWLDMKIAEDSMFCSMEQCSEERIRFEREDDYVMTCMAGLEEEQEFLLGDLNADAMPDAVVRVPWNQCDGGNAFHNSHFWLVILSQDGGTYVIHEDPAAVVDGLAEGGIYAIEDKVMKGEGLDYAEDDPRCCPSLSWEVDFAVRDGEIVEVRKTEVVREEMD